MINNKNVIYFYDVVQIEHDMEDIPLKKGRKKE